ncbi:pilus assembly PilX family protein [Uliginosibacterium gangwonense]|uniref:pilus assembly PilX family protein n=1 Tax=Uliginosibacterium gangwonense TaxID=392736 RepID=UPI00037B8F14|nr:hypothetical protein [Uliginosibacterium gangwonense]
MHRNSAHPHPSGRREAQRGFVLASAIFLLVIMAALAAFIVQVSVAGSTTSAQDIQGARAYQAARVGVEAGLFAVHQNGNCPGATMANIPGLNGFKVTWVCSATAFNDGADHNVWQITATACTTSGTQCPSTNTTELQSTDYIERQLVVLTEY